MSGGQRHMRIKKLKIQSILGDNPRICFYCKVELSIKKITFDHIVPKSKGGITCPDNLVVCCEKCNNEKDNQGFFKFRDKKWGI